MSKKLWGGRFRKGMDPRLRDFSYSLLDDQALMCAELSVNKAYVKMLARAKLVSAKEKAKLLKGLDAIGRQFKPGDLCLEYRDHEDIHSYIQTKLEKKAGAVAKKLHTGRSRNDLVVTSTRLYMRFQLGVVSLGMVELERSLVACAKKAKELILPGLTHLQKAQPVLLAHHFLAYVEMIEEDRARVEDAGKRLNVLPLGSAAIGGSALAIDRAFLARELGFAKVSTNSLAAVSDRAFLTEAVSALSIFWMHLSRLSEDMILWNSEAFGFIELDDAFATGSSLMPQKKNPDVFELLRGRSASVFAELMNLLAVQKGLPLAYNRDLQEDKPGVFRVLAKTLSALQVLPPTLTSMKFKGKAMAAALNEDGLYATDILEYLVRKKVPFSEAHTVVGQVVRYGADRATPLRAVPVSVWKRFCKAFGADVYRLFDAEASVRGKKTVGSTHPARVRGEIRKWERRLQTAHQSLKKTYRK